MEDSEKGKFVSLLTGIIELYEKQIDEFKLTTYWEILKGYEYPVVVDAFEKHVKHPERCKYFPKPGDIINAISGTIEQRALDAWSKALSGLRQYGTNTTVVFDDPAIHAVIHAMGGWVNFGKVTNFELQAKTKEFCSRYVGTVAKGKFEYPRQLTGSHANSANQDEEILFLGVSEKCEHLYLEGKTKMISCKKVGSIALKSLALLDKPDEVPRR